MAMAVETMPYRLSDVLPGRRVTIDAVSVAEPLNRRLAELGLTPGAEVTVIQSSGGPVVVAVRGARMALGWAIAQLISVTSPSAAG